MPSGDLQRFFVPLLERHVRLAAEARVLEMGYHDPAAALWAARRARQVLALRPSVDQVAEVASAARGEGLGNVEARLALEVEPEELGTFDVAVLLAPFFLGNAPVREALRAMAGALKPEGTLYLQVHRRRGGDTFVRYAGDLFGTVDLLGMGGGQRRLYRAAAPRKEALAAEASTPPEQALHEVTLRGVTLRLRLAAGVFAARGVDRGTRLLLESAEIPPGARVLDLGCGAGTIGLALALADPAARVVLTDTSRAAMELTRENAERNQITNVDVRLGDGYAAVAGERFDVVIANLPAHRGYREERGTAERFITEAPQHLRERGAAWFVTGRALRYEQGVAGAFGKVQVAADDGRYKVLHCAEPQAAHQAERVTAHEGAYRPERGGRRGRAL